MSGIVCLFEENTDIRTGFKYHPGTAEYLGLHVFNVQFHCMNPCHPLFPQERVQGANLDGDFLRVCSVRESVGTNVGRAERKESCFISAATSNLEGANIREFVERDVSFESTVI